MSRDVLKARIMTVMRNLPPMPQVTQKLLAVMRDENSSANDVTKVLSSDQALAGKVLKLVNSSFYGVPQEITTISRAVVMLGFTGVRNLALGFGSVEVLNKLSQNLDVRGFWSHAMANAVAAQQLAPLANRRTDPEEAFIAGLMHDIGSYVLAAAVPEDYKEIMAQEGDILELEREATGFTHAQIGQGLIQFWGLPEAFANAARFHHDVKAACGEEQPLTALVALADVLACIHGGAFESPPTEATLAALLSTTGITAEQMHSALLNMDKKLEDMSAFMSISGAGAARDAVPEAVQKRVSCVVTTDDSRRDWVQTLLRHFGHDLFPMEAYFNQGPGCESVQLVLVDPQCLTQQQLDRLSAYLATQQADVVMLYERGTNVPESVKAFPRLDFIFSRNDLRQMLAMQRV